MDRDRAKIVEAIAGVLLANDADRSAVRMANKIADRIGGLEGKKSNPIVKMKILEDVYIGWARYKGDNDRLETCDSDAAGAFKIYRSGFADDKQPAESDKPIKLDAHSQKFAEKLTGKAIAAIIPLCKNCIHNAADDTRCLTCQGEYFKAREKPAIEELREDVPCGICPTGGCNCPKKINECIRAINETRRGV